MAVFTQMQQCKWKVEGVVVQLFHSAGLSAFSALNGLTTGRSSTPMKWRGGSDRRFAMLSLTIHLLSPAKKGITHRVTFW